MKTKILVSLVFGLFLLSAIALPNFAKAATTQPWTVTFKIPTSVAITNTYNSPCSDSVFFFVENDGTYDGTQTQVNASDAAAATFCEIDGSAAFDVANGGNAPTDIFINFTTALPAGVTFKISQVASGFGVAGVCDSAAPPTTGCIAISATNTTTAYKIANDVAAAGNMSFHTWVTMASFNAGAAGEVARTAQTTGIYIV